MKTLSNTIAAAVQSVLVSAMPTSKTVATEHMTELLNDAILPLLPVVDIAKPETLAAWSKACSSKGVLIDTFNPLLAHVSDSQLFSRTENNNGELKEAFTYDLSNVDVSLDTVLRLATLLIQKHKRARPANMVEALHFTAEALEALELINNDATLAEDGESATSNKAPFNFTEHSLDAFMFATGNKSVYTMPNNGGFKVYLLSEFKREFDDLCDEGLLSEAYGRNLVREGDFIGSYAVLIPAKA